MRIAIAGFQHETNTFAAQKTDLDEFLKDKDWPGLCRGANMVDIVRSYHLPVAGAIDVFDQADDVEIVPLSWAFAMPSGYVTEHAFEHICGIIIEDLQAAMPVDGVYLDLHGAMVTEHLEDAEGTLIARIRGVVGPDIAIVSSLDYHANITQKMVWVADYIDIYRTYPHVDMAATGARAATVLLDMIRSGYRLDKAFRKPDFLIPLMAGCTDVEPAKNLMGDVSDKLRAALPADTFLSFAAGFSLSDIEEVGPAVLAYSLKKGAAITVAEEFLQAVNNSETEFDSECYSARDSVLKAVEIAKTTNKPVVIADVQDNPGAGGTADTTGLLHAMYDVKADNMVFGFMVDAIAAKSAHDTGVGATVSLFLGGRGFEGDAPFDGKFKVLALGDGLVTATGPMWKGAHMKLGPCALLQIDHLKIAICSSVVQTGDTSMYRHLGINPEDVDVITVKSSVHFRADFSPIAECVIQALTPGPVFADHSYLDYKHARDGVRLVPRQGLKSKIDAA
ncbi:MAG: M81 family metallopeptidase [Sneathiella sp.]